MKLRSLVLLGVLAVLVAPLYASADNLDVIVTKLKDGCTMEKYLAIAKDFNAYYADKGYKAEVLVPLHAETQNTVVWVGRSASTTAFGKAYDHWEAELGKKDSAVRKLNARFDECSTNTTRSSYVTAH